MKTQPTSAISSSTDHRSSDNTVKNSRMTKELEIEDTGDELPDVVSPLLRELMNRDI